MFRAVDDRAFALGKGEKAAPAATRTNSKRLRNIIVDAEIDSMCKIYLYPNPNQHEQQAAQHEQKGSNQSEGMSHSSLLIVLVDWELFCSTERSNVVTFCSIPCHYFYTLHTLDTH